MPSRKAEQIIKVLRDEILSGKRTPGEKLPTYDALMEQFRSRGLPSPGCSTACAARAGDRQRHTRRFHRRPVSPSQPVLLVTSEQPGSLEWTSFLATILDLIEKKRRVSQAMASRWSASTGAEQPEYSGCAKPWSTARWPAFS